MTKKIIKVSSKSLLSLYFIVLQYSLHWKNTRGKINLKTHFDSFLTIHSQFSSRRIGVTYISCKYLKKRERIKEMLPSDSKS